MSMLETLHSIAFEGRKWADGRKFKFKKRSLVGLCARTTAHLYRMVHKKLNICPKIHISWTRDYGSHVYLVVLIQGVNYVIDSTIAQFPIHKGLDYLVLEESKAQEFSMFYKSIQSFNSVCELQQYTRKYKWPKRQIAY